MSLRVSKLTSEQELAIASVRFACLFHTGYMTDDMDSLDLDSLSDPESLFEDEDIPFQETVKTFERRQFQRLRQRHETIDGLVQVALTTADGRLLLQGWEGRSKWAPPGFSVGAMQNWAGAAKNGFEQLTGVEVTLDEILLVEELTFRCAGTGESFTAYGVSYAGSLVDEDSEFVENPTVDEGSEVAEGNVALDWFTAVPEDVNEEYREYVERFVAHAQGE